MPFWVESSTLHSVPMMTTKSRAASVCPNQMQASGTQHTLGRACKPRASMPRVSFTLRKRAASIPSGTPSTRPMT